MGNREFLHHLEFRDTEPKWNPLSILLRIVQDTPLENLSLDGLYEAAKDIYHEKWGAKIDEARFREDLESAAVKLEVEGANEKA